MVALRILTRLNELEDIRAEWVDLWERFLNRTPFQRPEWIIAWCRHFDCRSIWTLTIRHDGRLIALAPWLVYQNGLERLVAFMAGGVSDYHDVLIDRDFEAEALAELWACLILRRDQWDACDFEQLAPWSLLRECRLPLPLRGLLDEGPPCPHLAMPRWPSALSEVVPSKQMARFAKYRRRAERQGELSFERSSTETIAAAWEDVFRLHRARWAGRGLSGALGDDRVCHFHKEVVTELAPACASIDRLKLDGKTIGALYGFVIGRTKYCYMQGVDPAAGALSPGLLLVGMVLEDAQRRGLERVDFLRGDEPYKLAWGPTLVTNARRKLWLRD
jgi:CelD/BcsL family acetyltransferase involved in cellulose biosynthesis